MRLFGENNVATKRFGICIFLCLSLESDSSVWVSCWMTVNKSIKISVFQFYFFNKKIKPIGLKASCFTIFWSYDTIFDVLDLYLIEIDGCKLITNIIMSCNNI